MIYEHERGNNNFGAFVNIVTFSQGMQRMCMLSRG